MKLHFYIFLQSGVVVSYLLCATALPRLCQHFDGGGALGHRALVVPVLLGVILGCTGDGLLTWRRRCAGCSLPLENCLLLAAFSVNINTDGYTVSMQRKI